MARLFIDMGRMEAAEVIQMNIIAGLQFLTYGLGQLVDIGICFGITDFGAWPPALQRREA